VLDAPALQDDFYLNLVDWSANNVLAVGLGPCIYLWSASTSSVTKLQDLGPNDQITSVQWSNSGATLAVGTHSGDLQISEMFKDYEGPFWASLRDRMEPKYVEHW
jgi:cell division cycle 20-like protein 1, cofactor of APC complex